jgi:hypothetical protein
MSRAMISRPPVGSAPVHAVAQRRTVAAAVVATVLALLLQVAAARSSGALSTAPEDLGPYAVQVSTVSIPVPASIDPPDPEGLFTAVLADVYLPQGAGPFPLLQMSHAWPDTRRNLAGWGMLLASRGIVVVISDRRTQSAVDRAPGPIATAGNSGADQLADLIDLNYSVNAGDVLRVVRWAIHQSGMRSSLLAGKVDRRRVAIAGHSLGGYYATFAADLARRQGVALSALLLLDPTDERLGSVTSPTPLSPIGWSSLHIAPNLRLPTAVLASEENTHPVQCNMSDGPDCTVVSEQEYAALGNVRARFGLKVLGSVHTDPEVADDSTRTEHQLLFQRYGVAWLGYWLQGDCDLSAYLGGTATQADQAAGLVRAFAGELLPDRCNS